MRVHLQCVARSLTRVGVRNERMDVGREYAKIARTPDRQQTEEGQERQKEEVSRDQIG